MSIKKPSLGGGGIPLNNGIDKVHFAVCWSDQIPDFVIICITTGSSAYLHVVATTNISSCQYLVSLQSAEKADYISVNVV